jgi:N-acetylglucosamine-6-phosphate deacetylase
MLSTTPAKHIKAEKLGEIKEGYLADLTLTDENFNVIATIKNGKTV